MPFEPRQGSTSVHSDPPSSPHVATENTMEMDVDSVTPAYSIDEERASPSSLAHVIDSPVAEEMI
eukprot:CAMPEP_0201960384 /NCGR_PEP_ID=MMETSP0904-20121228/7124_1 /ASSEMBLY_ACC=CAM_ASM_000553 /TAXON_ID=420261 /ORGANISM="Thalassiosira antarctica, Strain CCMP982" /LENGTH=64 /DNA_ID=CAMNT_0048506327 /DNA_START=5 /DNA_END=196 /DNA_ORIENTATION=+